MRRGYLQVGKGIHNTSGHGIDAVFQHVASGRIAVVESKFRAGWRATWNPRRLLSPGHGFRQLDHGWIEANVNLALDSDFAQAQRVGTFLDTHGYEERIFVVTNRTGTQFVDILP